MISHPEQLDLNWVRGRLEHYSIPVTECGCQIWMGRLDGGRYGNLRIKDKSYRAHRLSWMVANGPIPDGMYVLHRCDVPLCINPDHLFLGTQLENMRDMEAKGRGRQPRGDRNHMRLYPERVRRGEKHPRAKLSLQQVMEIRLWRGKKTEAAKRYGVTPTTIANIQLRKIWSHVA